MAAAVENVSVDLGRGDVLVAEQLLHGADVMAGLEEMRGERVAQRVCAYRFHDTGEAARFLKALLDDLALPN